MIKIMIFCHIIIQVYLFIRRLINIVKMIENMTYSSKVFTNSCPINSDELPFFTFLEFNNCSPNTLFLRIYIIETIFIKLYTSNDIENKTQSKLITFAILLILHY